MAPSIDDLNGQGESIALYIIAATYKTAQDKLARGEDTEPVAELDIIFEQQPNVAAYVGGILHHMAQTTFRDACINQSKLRFFIFDPGNIGKDYDSLAHAGSKNWPQIKVLIDKHLAR